MALDHADISTTLNTYSRILDGDAGIELAEAAVPQEPPSTEAAT